MADHNVPTDKERSLIAVGASVAAGCQPCTAFHIRAAAAAGACERGIAIAVEAALACRAGATAAMDEWALRCQGSRPEVDGSFREGKARIAELASVAAAVALNSVPDLRCHLVAAQQAGADFEQIRSAIDIARGIRRVAEEQIDAALSDLARTHGPQAATGSGCCGSQPAEMPGGRSGCGCR